MSKKRDKKKADRAKKAKNTQFARNPKMATRKEINRRLSGLRLVAMESNGYHEGDDLPRMRIAAKRTTLGFLADRGDADHVIRELQHKWLVTVCVVIKDWRGDIDGQTHHFLGWGKRVNDLSEKVQPALDRVRKDVNEKFIIDWGWFAEILPPDAVNTEEAKAGYEDKAELFLLQMIDERHLGGDESINWV